MNIYIRTVLIGLSIGSLIGSASPQQGQQPVCDWQPGPGFQSPPAPGCGPGTHISIVCTATCDFNYKNDIKAAQDTLCHALQVARANYELGLDWCNAIYWDCIEAGGNPSQCFADRQTCNAKELEEYLKAETTAYGVHAVAYADAVTRFVECMESCCIPGLDLTAGDNPFWDSLRLLRFRQRQVESLHVPGTPMWELRGPDKAPRMPRKPLPPL